MARYWRCIRTRIVGVLFGCSVGGILKGFEMYQNRNWGVVLGLTREEMARYCRCMRTGIGGWYWDLRS